METERVELALEALRSLTTCRCEETWTGRGLHAPGCAYEYAEDVQTVNDTLRGDRKDIIKALELMLKRADVLGDQLLRPDVSALLVNLRGAP